MKVFFPFFYLFMFIQEKGIVVSTQFAVMEKIWFCWIDGGIVWGGKPQRCARKIDPLVRKMPWRTWWWDDDDEDNVLSPSWWGGSCLTLHPYPSAARPDRHDSHHHHHYPSSLSFIHLLLAAEDGREPTARPEAGRELAMPVPWNYHYDHNMNHYELLWFNHDMNMICLLA